MYKVPQDVEAEDKLLGPFSFRQFVFLIIAVIGIAIAYGLSTILLPLAIIPVPIILFFGALALPLKKDQPMEVYLAAVISFMLKPKKRLWQPDGIERLVEVIAPKVEEKTYGNNYDQAEVQRRLSYLANLVDSQGWSIRGVNNPNSSMRADLFNEGQAANDILDENSATAQNINHLINQSDVRRRQEVIQKMQTEQSTTPPLAQPPQPSQPDNPTPATPLQMNPYPTMRQSVLNPVSGRPAANTPAQTQPTATPQASVNEVPPAIIELANNRDLSIETIAREANHIFYTLAGPEIAVATTKAYSTQLVAGYLLGVQFAHVRGTITEEKYEELLAALQELPDQIAKLLEDDKERIQWFAAKYANAKDVFFIGRGIDYAVSMEGSLKLKEISYIHSEAYAAGELKHGTISLIEDGTLVIGVLTQKELYEKTVSNLVEVKSRGAYLMGLTSYGNYEIEDTVNFTVYTPKTDPHFATSLAIIPLQLLGYYLSVARGLDVDKPRNLAKSVTVE